MQKARRDFRPGHYTICRIALCDTIYVTKSTYVENTYVENPCRKPYVETYAEQQRTPKNSVKSEKIQTATLPLNPAIASAREIS